MIIFLPLRTKLLLSLVLVTGVLTAAVLFVIRRSAESHIQTQIEENARSAIFTIQTIQHQHELVLRNKANLLATVAYMRNGDPSSIQDAGEDPWQSDQCDLFALADGKDKIVALHLSKPTFSVSDAEQLLHVPLKVGISAGWWSYNGHVFQVVLQRFYQDGGLMGTVIVGRELDRKTADDWAHISSSQLVIRVGDDALTNTLSLRQSLELAGQLPNLQRGQITLDQERFFAKTTKLNLGIYGPTITLTVLKSYESALASLNSLNELLAAVGLASVLIGGVLVFLIADRFTRPLAELSDGVRALERGDYAYPMKRSDGGDEVAQLTRTFEEMRSTLQRNETQTRELEGQLRQAQKMEAMGRLAGGVAHDFNNLLTIIKGNSDLLVERLGSNNALLKFTSQIESASDRAVSLTRQLLAFCRMQMLQPKILNLNELVSEMCKLLRRLVREDIAFNFQAGESLGRVKADPGQLEQILMNLVVNAGDAMPAGGILTVETRNVTITEEQAAHKKPILSGEYVLLGVTDNGLGMNAETMARIFEPFFTTKEQGKGTGLGLATVYGIVKQSGGYIWVESKPGQGARFEIYLPRVHQPVEATNLENQRIANHFGPKTVLIAEDEEAVRQLACEFLEAVGYKVLTAKNGLEAVAMAESSKVQIDLLLTDVVMPKMRGPELSKKLRSLRPDLKIVYMSGYLEFGNRSRDFLEDGIFLQKPFSRDSLVAKLNDAWQGNQDQPLGSATQLRRR